MFQSREILWSLPIVGPLTRQPYVFPNPPAERGNRRDKEEEKGGGGKGKKRKRLWIGKRQEE